MNDEPQNATFASWFSFVIQRHELVTHAPKRRRAGTWSEKLAHAMGEGPEYDAYLRRVARGMKVPRGESTYKIGEGLRAAGLPWCSGLLALLRNPRTRVDLFAMIDVASRQVKTQAPFAVWYEAATILSEVEVVLGDAEIVSLYHELLGLLAAATAEITPALSNSYAWPLQPLTAPAEGLLGIAYRIHSDPKFGPRSGDAVSILLGHWLSEMPPGGLTVVRAAQGLAERIHRLLQERELIAALDQQRKRFS